MVVVIDVAQYILEKLGVTSTLKLQKLVYYSQALHLVWAEKPLYPEEIHAWADGAVAPALTVCTRGNSRSAKSPAAMRQS